MRNHGSETKYYHQVVGGNFRLDALQAAVLRVKRRISPAWTDARRANAARYRGLFEEAAPRAGVTLAADRPARRPRHDRAARRASGRAPHLQSVRDSRRRPRRGAAHLTARGIGTEIYYPVPFHLQACFAALGYTAGDFPVAEAAAADSLALPIYGELTEAQQRYVVDSVVGMTASARAR